jgi:hypothetical protein
MSFLSKLFAKDTVKEQPSGHAKTPRQHPRVRILKFHDVELKSESGVLFEIANLSVGGIGVCKFAPEILVKDRVTSLSLRLGERTFLLRARVAYVREGFAGLEFLAPPSELLLSIRKQFELELGSLKMTEIRSDLLKQDPLGSTRCWMGDRNCEFLVVISPSGELVRYQVSFFGNVVQGAPGMTPRVEQIADEDERDRGAGYRSSTVVKRSDRSVEELMPELARFIEQIDGLDAQIRDQVLGSLS